MDWFKRELCGLILILCVVWAQGQSPHGKELTISCNACHTSDSWAVSRDSISFNHDTTRFLLQGEHKMVDCRQCHSTLEFSKAETNCISCHLDIHQGTVGQDCGRCHDSKSWLVSNIAEVHRQISFPLLGAHALASCAECHTSETSLRFAPIGDECINCHQKNYDATTNPDHKKAGYSTECIECHKIDAFEWTASGINHDFFPLTQGHAINECATCHTGPDYSKTSPECITCHEANYLATTSPNHQAINISTSCVECHTTQPGWRPAEFKQHDALYFPIYSGAHNGVWDNCVDCHKDQSNYSVFTCITCHGNPETDNKHDSVLGYSYSSTACLACHPNGRADGTFNHNLTNFPLTGAHTTVECLSCHANGFTGTPTQCVACHTKDFNQSVNPNHINLGLSTDCISCHTTAPNWTPAAFPNHNDFYVLNGAHAKIANDCAACHQGEYSNTPTTCVGCHLQDYNQTDAPSHTALHFSMECASCHTEDSWSPVTFDHNATNFPLTGAHTTVECLSCHANGYAGTPTECQSCHTTDFNQTLNPKHQALGFSTDCATCHTTEPGWKPATLINHNDYYVLSGAHAAISTQCASCHNGDYNNTPNTCSGCHLQDYNQTTNPPHITLQFSQDCASCHSESAWVPATFDHDGQYFPIYSGSHKGQWNQCTDCHTTPGNYSLFTCITCHANPETDQKHNGISGYVYNSSACLACHPNGEGLGGFDHNTTNFPLTGAHESVNCVQCHSNGYAGTPTECVACHTANFNQSLNPNHVSLGISTDCITCHTTAPGWNPATFNNHNDYYPLNGAHALISTQCITCHNGDYNNTPTTCVGCHQSNYNGTTNPSHTALQLSTDCATCHTESTWSPASFPNHNDFYPLNGAHATIANQCVSCHSGAYNNAPTTCVGCHQDNYNATTNPSHVALGFGTDCVSCHSETAWTPANFNHDAQYFPIYSGTHQGVWNQCSECHTTPGNYALFTCVTCHANPETDQQHNGINGYVYNSSACLACHPTGQGQGGFDHNTTNFPLTGAHTTVNCINCHSAGYAGTPTNCDACHLTDFNQATNPNHVALNFSTDCASCHTTAPNWNPATLANHNQYYVLEGAHAIIANQCATCHNGNYNNTPNTCVGCHLSDYNSTNNPSHTALNFSTDCASCHMQTTWSPAEYTDHDDAYFPIYSGGHQGAWDQCTDCHTNPNNYSVYTCITCHANPQTNQQHNGVNGYIYQNAACFACHPTGDAQGAFDHNASNFPLTGAHLSVNCVDCHSGGYAGTPTNCDACHMSNFNQASNPNHVALGLSTDCVTCHTTAPGWNPALFPNHNNYYQLQGAHAAIANQCATCHNGNYNNTPSTCVGCHQTEYNQTNDPNHQSAQFPTTCETCHSQNAWTPSTWNHDNLYFPIYSGKHKNKWDQCSDCHTNPNNYASFTCVTCHHQSETNNDHQGVNGYQYNSNACYNCHPNGEAD